MNNRPPYVVCVDNSDYPESLERGKAYRTLPDPAAEKHGFIRVIDESGEDYLFPRRYFSIRNPDGNRNHAALSPITVFRLFLLHRFNKKSVPFEEILCEIRASLPELCNDSVLCRHERPHRPEWEHQVRHALDYLKNKRKLVAKNKAGQYVFP